MKKKSGASRSVALMGIGVLVVCNLACQKMEGDRAPQRVDPPSATMTPSPSASPSASSPVESEIEKSAQDFFLLLAAKDYSQAYNHCGSMLQKDVDLAGFEQLVKSVGLDTYQELSWTESEPSPPGTSLSGSLTLLNNEKLDIELVLQEVDGQWLIQGLNYQIQVLEKPDYEDCINLAQGTLQSLGTYLDQGTLEPFAERCHSAFANKLRNENVLDPFLKKFGDPARLFFLLHQAVVFTSEPPDESGVLILEGRTKLNEKQEYLNFKLVYVPESKRWALENMDLWVRGPGDMAPKPAIQF